MKQNVLESLLDGLDDDTTYLPRKQTTKKWESNRSMIHAPVREIPAEDSTSLYRREDSVFSSEVPTSTIDDNGSVVSAITTHTHLPLLIPLHLQSYNKNAL